MPIDIQAALVASDYSACKVQLLPSVSNDWYCTLVEDMDTNPAVTIRIPDKLKIILCLLGLSNPILNPREFLTLHFHMPFLFSTRNEFA
jgi:hypothetical protein